MVSYGMIENGCILSMKRLFVIKKETSCEVGIF